MKKFLLGMLLTTLPMAASAITITVDNLVCSNSGAYTTANCNALKAEVEKDLQADLPDVSIDKYGTGVANATGFAMKGQGSDYAENFKYFVFKPSFGVAMDGDIDKPENASGVGLGGALTVGLNLDLLPVDKIGPVEMKDLDLFVSFMSYDVDETSDDTTFAGDLSSFGVYARYRFMEGKDILPGYMLEWGGIHLHTGFQRNKMGIKLTQSFKDQTVTSGAVSGSFNNASAVFDLDSTVTSIPVEVSTYIRALYVFTLYTGAGFDYNIGSADASLTASGKVQAANASDFSVDISAAESGKGDAKATNFRGFLGMQFNVPFVRLYVHVNKGFGSDLIGANFGAKITY